MQPACQRREPADESRKRSDNRPSRPQASGVRQETSLHIANILLIPRYAGAQPGGPRSSKATNLASTCRPTRAPPIERLCGATGRSRSCGTGPQASRCIALATRSTLVGFGRSTRYPTSQLVQRDGTARTVPPTSLPPLPIPRPRPLQRSPPVPPTKNNLPSGHLRATPHRKRPLQWSPSAASCPATTPRVVSAASYRPGSDLSRGSFW